MINGFLLVSSLGSKSVSTPNDGTYMSGGFATSLVCQDTSSDKDANGQPLCPHTSLDNLPHQSQQIRIFRRGEGTQNFTYLLRRRLMPILHNDSSSQTQTRGPTSQNQRILVLHPPIANLLLRRKPLPSSLFRVFLFVKQVLPGTFPESIV